MKYIKLGKSDLEISRMGFGAWAIGGPWQWGWGQQDDADSVKAIHAALDSGINWIDTAPAYGVGHSEKIIGQAIKTASKKPMIFTKCGLVFKEGEKFVTNKLSRESILKEVDDSLRRLQIDVIDLYQIHWPIPDEELEEAWATMAELQKAGKIRYLGVSNTSIQQIERLQKIAPVTTAQPKYNAISREIETDMLPFCMKHEIGTLAYSPMSSGLLTGKMTRERIAGLDDGDWRKKDVSFNEPDLTKNLAIVDRMAELAGDKKVTIPEIAISWALHQKGITAAIVGMRNERQVDGVKGATDIVLAADELAYIGELL